MSAADDRALLLAWCAGDRGQGNELFRRHAPAIARFFRTKVPDAAEELAQRTFLALLENAGAFREQSSFRTYLFGIARNQLLMYLRAKARAQHRFDPLTWSVIDAGAGPARIAAKHQQQQLLLSALQQLPVDYQIALELHYYESMSVAEIGAVLEQPAGTIKSRLSRARAQLREILEALAESADLLSSTVNDVERWAKSLSELAVESQG